MKPHGYCEGKRRYKKIDDAYRGLYHLWRTKQEPLDDLHVYECPNSTKGRKHYHFGHKSRYREIPKR